jgi:predicted flap endonuclease-1-like 5' DNA nuclease
MEAQVEKSHGLRSARGFSLSEVRKVGLTIRQVRTLGIYVDSRRRTLHEFNVETLKMLVEERQKQLEEESKARMEKEETVEKVEKKKAKKKEKPKKVEKVEKEKPKKVEKVEKEKPKKVEKVEEKEEIDLTEIKGVGEKKAETLKSAGIFTVNDLLKADTAELAEKTKFSETYIEKLKKNAETL